MPIYNFVTHTREEKTTVVYGANVILFEGVLALYDRLIRDMMDVKVIKGPFNPICIKLFIVCTDICGYRFGYSISKKNAKRCSLQRTYYRIRVGCKFLNYKYKYLYILNIYEAIYKICETSLRKLY